MGVFTFFSAAGLNVPMGTDPRASVDLMLAVFLLLPIYLFGLLHVFVYDAGASKGWFSPLKTCVVFKALP